MSHKYDTNRNSSGRQQERVVASWTEHPYTAYDKRSWAIEHRIVVEAHPGAGVDVRHEVRSDDADGVSAEWAEAEVYEAREHGVDKIARAEGEEWWA